MNIGSSVIIMSLIICLGMAYLADLVGLSSVVGAFLRGIAVGQTDAKQKLISILKLLAMPCLFRLLCRIGLSVTFNTLGKDLPFILVMTIMAILTKLLGGAGGENGWLLQYKFFNGRCWDGFAWEMALIIAQIGYQSKLLSEAYYTSMIVVIILTTLVAPFLLKYFVKTRICVAIKR